MEEPTEAQLQLYELCYTLAKVMFQPIHIVRLDERTLYLFILAGREEAIEFEVDNKGELVDEYNRKTIPADDPEWQQKVIASIKRQMGEKFDNGDQPQP